MKLTKVKFIETILDAFEATADKSRDARRAALLEALSPFGQPRPWENSEPQTVIDALGRLNAAAGRANALAHARRPGSEPPENVAVAWWDLVHVLGYVSTATGIALYSEFDVIDLEDEVRSLRAKVNRLKRRKSA